MTMFIPQADLDMHWPTAPLALRQAIAESSDVVLPKYEITTPLRLAHFLAQLSVESDAGTRLEENLNYRHAAVLMRVWPSRFPTLASTQGFLGVPKALALKVYGDRMGNNPNTDDGWTYRGRGLIQITGRHNFVELADHCGLPLEDQPELASDPQHCLDVAGAFWQSRALNDAADDDDVEDVTRLVNGGLNGLEERASWLRAWKEEISKEPGQ